MLVVTIVVLLILAGITITYAMGDNSIFKQAQNAKLQTEIAKAREKLEITFGHAKLLKHTDKKYDQDDYLDDLMKKEIPNIEILDEVVNIDGYVFEIDRSEPKIGEYVGKRSELVFPEVTATVTIADDNKTATIHITAKEETNGISKIEIIQEGHVLETYECENSKEEITKEYTAKQNGTYTVKVYAGLTAKELIEVNGIVMAITYTPNGDETYKKAHQVEISANETEDKVKSIKYQWLNTTAEPEASTFTTTCNNGETIIKDKVTGTYYLWTLLETEKGKTRIERSEGFNFDNQGPTVNVTSTPVSATSFTLTATASDNYSGITKYDFYVNGETEPRHSEETTEETASYTMTGVKTGNTSCYVIVTDGLGNETKKTVTGVTKLYTWEKWSTQVTYIYEAKKYSSSSSSSTFEAFLSNWSVYTSYRLNQQNGCFEGIGAKNVSIYNIVGCYANGGFNTFYQYTDYSVKRGDGFAGNRYVAYYDKYEIIKKNGTPIKGTTNLGNVTSDNSSAYPTNGISGSYWYVYKGVQ